MEDSTIQRRVAAREQARTVAGLVVEEAGRIAPDAQGAFWGELRKMLPFPVPGPAAATPEPFSDRQAQAFGRTRIPFGKHAGTRVDEAPLEYLEYLCDPQPFTISLRRYLASGRIRQEAEE